MNTETVKSIFRYLTHHKTGRCTVCGKVSIFLCLDTVETARNHMNCVHCYSSSRKRHVAKVILEKYRLGRSIKGVYDSSIRIYNTASKDAFSAFWRDYSGYYCSDFIDGVPAGTEISERAYCQNLEQLSFADESFDLVITEDVFEHIRDDSRAFSEIYRVLRQGGLHVFTVPFLFDRPTLTRVDTSSGKDVMVLPPEYHGDPLRGQILAYRTYGTDLYARLAGIGFATSVVMSEPADLRCGIMNSYVFVSEK